MCVCACARIVVVCVFVCVSVVLCACFYIPYTNDPLPPIDLSFNEYLHGIVLTMFHFYCTGGFGILDIRFAGSV